MNFPKRIEKTVSQAETTDAGAYAAWGMIIGAVTGGLLGCLFDQTLVSAILAALAGWIVGAVIERAKT